MCWTLSFHCCKWCQTCLEFIFQIYFQNARRLPTPTFFLGRELELCSIDLLSGTLLAYRSYQAWIQAFKCTNAQIRPQFWLEWSKNLLYIPTLSWWPSNFHFLNYCYKFISPSNMYLVRYFSFFQILRSELIAKAVYSSIRIKNWNQ